MVHQHELEAELAYNFSKLAPEVIGNNYIMLGTIEKKVWKSGLEGEGSQLDEVLKHTADFKKVLDLHYRPAGWYRAEDEEGGK
jgi:hypothetical protein